MKKVKMLLEPTEVEMIRDALQVCYDEGFFDDDMLESLCHVFSTLVDSGGSVKVSAKDDSFLYETDPEFDPENEIVSDEDDLDDCQCDECRADRGLPPYVQGCDGDPEFDGAEGWDTNDGYCSDCGCSECECDDNYCFECGNDPCRCHAETQVGCGVTKEDLENAWNANEPWNTDKK